MELQETEISLFFPTSLFLISWLGLNLLEILITLHGIGDDRLHVQIDVFHEENHRDKELMSSTQSDFLDLDSHTDVFHKLYHTLANTPQASVLLNILRGMLLLDHKDPHWLVWNIFLNLKAFIFEILLKLHVIV